MNSLAELPSERQCHKQLFKIVWGEFSCPYCNGRILLRDRYVWCPYCRKKHSVRAETWFRGSKLSFQKIWLIIWCWQKKRGIGATRDIVGVTYTTIRRWFRRLRKQLPRHNKEKLAGVIEIDESFFGRRRYGRQTIVIGAIERHKTMGRRRVRLKIIPDRERETIEPFVENNVEVGSLTLTDCLWSYNELELLGYDHEFCNHSKGHFGPTNLIENLWSVTKRHIRSLYNNLSASDLEYILVEWENRQNNPELFYTVEDYLKGAACSALV